MNVIRQPKRGAGGGGGGPWAPGRGRASGKSTSRGVGRGVADFDLIQHRPGPRVETSSSNNSSNEMKTPNNLLLGMAISSAVATRRGRDSTSSNTCVTTSSPTPHVFAVPRQMQNIRTPSSSSKELISSSSGSYNDLNKLLTRNTVTPQRKSRLGPRTPDITRATPQSASTSACDQNSSNVVLAITEGRGHARGEVGMAIMDVKRPKLILCQLSDRQTYSNTLTKINIFHPVEILLPHTFVDGNQPNRLYQVLQQNFPYVSMTKVQRRLFKESEGIEKLQHLSLPESASCQLLLKDKFYALAATAALLRYVEFVLNVIFSAKSLRVEYQGAHDGAVIDVRTAQALELLLNQGTHTPNYTLFALLDYCCTHGGRRLLRASLLHPPCSLQFITRRQDSVQELVENKTAVQEIREILKQIPDVEQLLTLCMQTPSTIDSNQSIETRVNYVLLLKSTLDILPNLAKSLESCHSHRHSKAKECFEDSRRNLMRDRILETLNEDVKNPKGTKTATFQRCFAVKSGINELLDVGRKTYCELINDMYDHVQKMETELSLPLKMNYSVTKGYHILITPQRNRPVKESDLPRVFLQVQKSRNTLSCTTDILVHANERLKLVSMEILNMSNTLLTVLLNDIRQYIGYLYAMCESIAELDLILALSQISSSHDYVRPHFDEFMKIKASRHPILESITSCDPTANDVEATGWSNLSIITGPNMSGKSSYIKQVLLLQIMAQVGCYVPATEATFRITDRIFSHLNFDDSIENNASTLSLEEINLILSSLTAKSLVALDELCRGTSVEEGTALAWTICEELSQSTAFVFVTTHFVQLTSLASVYPCIKNLHLETLEEPMSDGKIKLTYTHRLKPGINPVKNYGLRLAETFNIPKLILDDAWRIASQMETRSQGLVSTTEGDEEYTLFLAFEKLKFLAQKEDLTADDLRAARAQINADLAAARARAQKAGKCAPAAPAAGVKPATILCADYLSSSSSGLTSENVDEGSPMDVDEVSDEEFLGGATSIANNDSFLTSDLSPTFSVKSAAASTWRERDLNFSEDTQHETLDEKKGDGSRSPPISTFGSFLSDAQEVDFPCHSNDTLMLPVQRMIQNSDSPPRDRAISPISLYSASRNPSPDVSVEEDDSNSSPDANYSQNTSMFGESVFSFSPKSRHSLEGDTLNSWERSEHSEFSSLGRGDVFQRQDHDDSMRGRRPLSSSGARRSEENNDPTFLHKPGFSSFGSDDLKTHSSKRTAEDEGTSYSPILTIGKKRAPLHRNRPSGLLCPPNLNFEESEGGRSNAEQPIESVKTNAVSPVPGDVSREKQDNREKKGVFCLSTAFQSIVDSYAFSDSDCSD